MAPLLNFCFDVNRKPGFSAYVCVKKIRGWPRFDFNALATRWGGQGNELLPLDLLQSIEVISL